MRAVADGVSNVDARCMDTDPRSDGGRRSAADYQALLAQHAAGTLSLRAFAEQHGISPWTLYSWRTKLGVAKPPRRRRAKRVANFLEVAVVDRPAPSARASDPRETIELHLRGDVRLVLPASTSASRVAELARALSSC